jgi:hypothetical protein
MARAGEETRMKTGSRADSPGERAQAIMAELAGAKTRAELGARLARLKRENEVVEFQVTQGPRTVDEAVDDALRRQGRMQVQIRMTAVGNLIRVEVS